MITYLPLEANLLCSIPLDSDASRKRRLRMRAVRRKPQVLYAF